MRAATDQQSAGLCSAIDIDKSLKAKG